MNDNGNKPSITSLEAPASWNTRYQTPDGFVCQITLRADSGKDLLEKASAATAYLLEAGCTPCEAMTFRPKSYGNGQKSRSNGNTDQNSSEQCSDEGNSHLCPIHNTAMKRWEKNGRVWYSHKIDSGWCTGKQSA